MYIKVCGLKSSEMVEVAIGAGADAIGVVHAAGSPRHLDMDTAREVIAAARGRVDTALVVATFPVLEAVEMARELGVSVLQLHGNYAAADFAYARENFSRIWRATSLKKNPDLHVGAQGEELILLDAPKAGSGEAWDLSALATSRPDGNWLLAGGLNPENVAQAIAVAQPWGVDVSSGVESAPGKKDSELIRLFVARARAAA
ncbi:phosphoribosylanthranilate isomerase [Actinomycetaceae bacterium L2_0104]